MTRQLGIDFITMLGMPPIDYVRFAAALSIKNISMSLSPFTANPHGYPAWSLREDATMRRDLASALSDHGVGISVGEFILVRPGSQIEDAAEDLALFHAIGARSVNILSVDPDISRSIDQIGRFSEMAATYSMPVTLEFMAGTGIGTLNAALDAVNKAGQRNLSVLVDCMHFARSGASVAELAAVGAGKIGYLQLCDVLIRPLDGQYGAEALNDRLAPGDGELPLAAILSAVPKDVPIGLEIPMRSKALAGRTPQDYVGDAVAKARKLLDELEHEYDD